MLHECVFKYIHGLTRFNVRIIFEVQFQRNSMFVITESVLYSIQKKTPNTLLSSRFFNDLKILYVK